jgi:hypothetical protein
MLLVAFITTKPLMQIAAKSGPTSIKRLIIFGVLLGWPLLTPSLAQSSCKTAGEMYLSLFIGCINRSMGAMRFSAFTYMFFFNFGCIVSLITLEFAKSGRKFTLPSLKELVTSPVWMGYAALLSVEEAVTEAVQVSINFNQFKVESSVAQGIAL